MDDNKHYCWAEGCNNEIPEPVGCCSGRECGCMGQPIDPPFCSNTCHDKYLNKCGSCNGTGIVEGEHFDDKQGCLTCNGRGHFN